LNPSMYKDTMRVIGGMIPDPPWPARYECARWAHVNLGDIDSYPPMNRVLDNLLGRFSRIVAGKPMPAVLTSGATESNILALYYWRSTGKNRVVLFKHTHYSVLKGAKLLGMRYTVIDPEDLEKIVSSSDVIVATLGTTELGCVDDLEVIRSIAESRGARVHIDAAYYGAIYRYLHNLNEIVLDDTVATLSVDLHKIPEAPPPAGVLIVSSRDIINNLYFKAEYIPSGSQFGLLGTRPGCVIPAASIALRLTMERWPGGPAGLARDLQRVVDDVTSSLEYYGYRAVGGPAPIRCLIHNNIKKILRYFHRKGFRAYTCNAGQGIRFVAMPHHIWKGYNWIIQLLAEASRG
ncbi:MAG: pyridoxal-dependent decarboxylase, partial [Desulfurococcales archaeon]|nr:pyridoxal-dependent decarboxylase [Desulfurococcales archaeon]